MPEYIKAYSWDQWKGDVKFKVASPDDLDELDKKITALRNSLSSFASETALQNLDTKLVEKINEIQESFQNFCVLITNVLSNGQWKDTFTGEIATLLHKIETRYKEINSALDEKMIKLAETGAIEEKVKMIFLDEEKQIRTIIQQEGNKVKTEMEMKLQNAEILDIIRTESQTIRWE